MDGEKIPKEILEGAFRTGFTPDEIMYFFTVIQNSVRDGNPYPLADMILFPIHEESKCPGDVLETREEFIDRYSDLMDEKTRSEILSIKAEELLMGTYGVGIEKLGVWNPKSIIWISGFCDSAECGSYSIYITHILGYRTDMDQAEGIFRNPEYTPPPTFKPKGFEFGKYEYFSSVQPSGESRMILDETLAPWMQFSITITDTVYAEKGNGKTGTFVCTYESLEYCPAYGGWGTAEWFGLKSIGGLNIICNYQKRSIIYLDILEGKQIGYMVNGYLYLVLEKV
jgi:hypothetical protein